MDIDASIPLIDDHALFAHVEAGLAGALVRAVLETHDVLSLSNLLIGELTLVLSGQFGSEAGSGVFGVGLALQLQQLKKVNVGPKTYDPRVKSVCIGLFLRLDFFAIDWSYALARPIHSFFCVMPQSKLDWASAKWMPH